MNRSRRVAVVGSGPAGLMAATRFAELGYDTHLFEKRKSAGRKLLVAGSSGLNITYDAPLEEFVRFYGDSSEWIRPMLEAFPPDAWREFIEDLGIGTFKGTSRRYFVEGMKAPELLKAWMKRLESLGVRFHFGAELIDFDSRGGLVSLRFSPQVSPQVSNDEFFQWDAACIALGGGSWEPHEKPLRWVEIFKSKGLGFTEFRSSNVGFQVAWPEKFLQEAEGKPLKNVVLRTSRGERSGDLVVTRYGIEGTPVYAVGEPGQVFLDLKPDLSESKVLSALSSGKENLSPIRRVKRFLKLSDAAFALVFHLTPSSLLVGSQRPLEGLASRIKHFPLLLGDRQPLDEAISSAGGVSRDELDAALMLRRFPGIFVAGEMIDWDAPTGGFLIQACVSQGDWVAQKVRDFR